MTPLPLRVMSSAAIVQRRDELLRARRVLDDELRRVSAVLADRNVVEPPAPARQRVTEHGAAGYRKGCRCQVCRAGHAAEARDGRARRHATTNPDTPTVPAQPTRRTP